MTITSETHFWHVQDALRKIDTKQFDHIVDLIETAKLIVTCGNGGSAATAMHFAGDLRSLGLPAFDLLSPVKLTQIGNDRGYSNIFLMQSGPLDALVIAFSCSGTSPNIEYLYYHNSEDMILFTSDKLKEKYQCNVVRVESTDYEVIEDVHSAMCHAIKKELVERQKK